MQHRLFSSSELLPGEMRSAEIENTAVVVFRLTNGGLYALENCCSHAEVELSGGEFDGSEVTCPAHGARFDVCTGKPRCLPAVRAVRTFPIIESDGGIWIEIPS